MATPGRFCVMDASVHNASTSLETVPSRKRNHASISSAGPEARVPDPGPALSYGVCYNFVGNSFVLSESRTWMKVHDPASQGFLTRVPETTTGELQSAVATATAALPAWTSMSASNRRKILFNLLPILRQNSSRIRHMLCVEVGKTLNDADAEFERGMDAIETACSVPNELAGQHHVNQSAEIHTIQEPLGVCLIISPFNFPFLIPLWFIPYAILAGNTVLLKPSERTPSVSQIMAECFLQAGFLPGVFNVLHGGANVVTTLLSQPVIRAVSFVGSTIAGEQVYEHARATRKRIQVECSGKNHGVVLDDADKRKSLYAIAGSAFGAAGQRCMALSVVVFVGATRDWIGELIQVAESLVVGCGLDPLVDVGPVITADTKQRIEDTITAAEHEGAKVALDGRNYKVPDYPSGNFIGPTILTQVQPYMSCYQEEIFGPVLCCVEAATLAEAVDLVNNNRYGNGVTLFTSSPTNARVFQHSVNVGQIGINVPVIAPSGPVLRTANKESFLGDLNVYGKSNAQFFTMTKTVTSIWH